MNWEAVKPIATLCFTTTLKFVGGALVTHGVISAGPGVEAFTGAAMAAGGAFWSWWVESGHSQAGKWLQHITDTATQAAAIQVAKQMSRPAIADAVKDAKAQVTTASAASVAAAQ